MTDILRRNLAPIADPAWRELELQSLRTLAGNLSGRKLVDFQGPHGWPFAAVNLGRLELGAGPGTGEVAWGLHQVLPLVEIRVPFRLGIWDLDDLERGARNPDLRALVQAAQRAALFEERALYHGFAGAGIQGILEAPAHAPIPLPGERGKLTEAVELGLIALQQAAVGGPYALVLGTEPYTWLMVGDPNAYPLRKRVEALVSGGIHWSPALEGGLVLSRRGGDFELTVGQDLSLGYKGHDALEVELYFAESFTFRVLEGAAAVELRRQGAA